jgi:hypothetical protein
MTQPPLPTSADWSFGDISLEDPDRAALLESCSNANLLTADIASAARNALHAKAWRYGWERSEGRPAHRAVFQFPLNPTLFDWFQWPDRIPRTLLGKLRDW